MISVADVSETTSAQLVSLNGRSAVVTGGARGLGKAIAGRLAEAGASVLIGDRDEAGAREAAEELSRGGTAKVTSSKLDVSDTTNISDVAQHASDTLGGINTWINNAGIFPRRALLDMTPEAWDEVMGVNLRGVLMGCREAALHMIASGNGGTIVNIASTAGFRGSGAGLSSYVSSKHGVVGVTRQLALELAQHRIRVLGIAPSVVLTEGVQQSRETARTTGNKVFTFPCPLGRIGVPDDIARVALFCASDPSIYMTGTTLPVDAGMLSQ